MPPLFLVERISPTFSKLDPEPL